MLTNQFYPIKKNAYENLIHIDRMERRLDFENHKYELVIDEPKGLKHRTFPISDEIKVILKMIQENCETGDYLFMLNGKRCTERAIEGACTRRANEAGIHTSVHAIRRTVSSELNKYLPSRVVASLMGHIKEVNEGFYNFDNLEEQEKACAIKRMYSNVLIFPQDIKTAENQ